MLSCDIETLARRYREGFSLPQISREFSIPITRVRTSLLLHGVELRTRSEGTRLAANQGRLGASLKGESRTFSDEHKLHISQSRAAWGELNSCGTSKKKCGYVVYTRGPNKGRFVHTLIMEERIGRRILPDEVIHHIDGNRSNNSIDNLALMTKSAHSRLHRREEALSGKERIRDNGRFC